MILPINSLMLDASADDDLYRGHDQNSQIEKEALTLKIFGVEGDLMRDRQLVSAIYLSPACEPRQQQVHTVRRACSNEVVLIEQSRSWAYETHVSLQYAPELRQFI